MFGQSLWGASPFGVDESLPVVVPAISAKVTSGDVDPFWTVVIDSDQDAVWFGGAFNSAPFNGTLYNGLSGGGTDTDLVIVGTVTGGSPDPSRTVVSDGPPPDVDVGAFSLSFNSAFRRSNSI